MQVIKNIIFHISSIKSHGYRLLITMGSMMSTNACTKYRCKIFFNISHVLRHGVEIVIKYEMQAAARGSLACATSDETFLLTRMVYPEHYENAAEKLHVEYGGERETEKQQQQQQPAVMAQKKKKKL